MPRLRETKTQNGDRIPTIEVTVKVNGISSPLTRNSEGISSPPDGDRIPGHNLTRNDEGISSPPKPKHWSEDPEQVDLACEMIGKMLDERRARFERTGIWD
jgi:hypothetical protein